MKNTAHKPILVVQHAAYDWPGYFTDCLNDWSIAWHLVDIAQGDTLPTSLEGFGGLALMGGGMSVHDTEAYPHLHACISLIQQAIEERIPVIGHCLGGQLLALASGGEVVRAPSPEIGWHTVHPTNDATAYEWLGSLSPTRLFEWHNEMFHPPQRAHVIASSLYCPNQAFILDGIHLGMQFHCEALTDKINHWLVSAREDIELANNTNVHDAQRITRDNVLYTEIACAVARSLYARWLEGVRCVAQ